MVNYDCMTSCFVLWQINCFQMEKKASHSFVRVSPVYEVNVRRSDVYSEVISKICAVYQLLVVPLYLIAGNSLGIWVHILPKSIYLKAGSWLCESFR